MFEEDHLFAEVSLSNLEAYRDAKRRAERDKARRLVEALRVAELEQKPAELDDAICSWEVAQLEALRDWASDADPLAGEVDHAPKRRR